MLFKDFRTISAAFLCQGCMKNFGGLNVGFTSILPDSTISAETEVDTFSLPHSRM